MTTGTLDPALTELGRISVIVTGTTVLQLVPMTLAVIAPTLTLTTAPGRRDIFVNIFMPTTVHIPDPLLKAVDRRAKALGISRNRLVVRALEQAVRERSGWTPEFLERLRRVDSETSAAADELLTAVKQARRSKEPHEL
jgi:hypothetical protein